MLSLEQATLELYAEFPQQYFLENLAVRADGSILVSAMNKRELWCIPPPGQSLPLKPQLVHTFDLLTLNMVETEPDIFYLTASDIYHTRVSRLFRLDLRAWQPGVPLQPEFILEFPDPKVGVNGSCLIAPGVLLVAGATDLIWRVDLPPVNVTLPASHQPATARIWLQHDNMKNRPGQMKPEQPGTNGVRFDQSTNFVYYTSTSQQLMMRVAVDPVTHDPIDLPVFIAGGREWDDFVIDEVNQVAYVTTHRENTIDRVWLQPDGNRAGRAVIAGNPFTDLLVGPSSGVWGRAPADPGRVAYFTTDGGTAQSPDGILRTAKVLRVTFPPVSSNPSIASK